MSKSKWLFKDVCFLLVCRYLTLVESLPTYGVHYYEVKVGLPLWLIGSDSCCMWKRDVTRVLVPQDKQGMPWWLGISYKGIGQYDLQDKLKPRKVNVLQLCLWNGFLLFLCLNVNMIAWVTIAVAGHTVVIHQLCFMHHLRISPQQRLGFCHSRQGQTWNLRMSHFREVCQFI